MAEAPGHRLGQIIGDSLEIALEPVLRAVADAHGLYLDCKGERDARPGKKLTWKDSLGNSHDLDYVLERGGTETEIGVPVAFIETAWRRYTKHSKNKAQEIQGAIQPLLVTHSDSKPFPGAVLAGEFTSTSLDQLRSNGFAVLYIPYGEIITAFAEFGIDVAYDETTPDDHLAAQIATYDRLSAAEREGIGEALRKTAPDEFKSFGAALDAALSRRVETFTIIPLHGQALECATAAEAIKLVREYGRRSSAAADLPFLRFEVIVRYSNGDRITGDFADSAEAEAFLRTFA